MSCGKNGARVLDEMLFQCEIYQHHNKVITHCPVSCLSTFSCVYIPMSAFGDCLFDALLFVYNGRFKSKCLVSCTTAGNQQARPLVNPWARLFKAWISLIQRINPYLADKIYSLASVRLHEGWIALSSHYPSDKFIQLKVGCITFIHWIKERSFDS